jgi:hypothetical protein
MIDRTARADRDTAPPRLLLAFALFASAVGTSSCAETAASPRTTVFDPTAAVAGAAAVDVASSANSVETPYPPLDRPVTGEGSAWIGVSVLGGGVRFARPVRWRIRDAALDPGRALVRYVSPSAYSFAIYERSDAPDDLWRDIQQRYEAGVLHAGARIAERAVPMATQSAQGRAYVIERREPHASRSWEYLLRGAHRVVLVQVVTAEPDLARLDRDLLSILNSMEIL